MQVQVLQPSPAGFVAPFVQVPPSAGHIGGPTSGQFHSPPVQLQLDADVLDVPSQWAVVRVYGQVSPSVVQATPRPS